MLQDYRAALPYVKQGVARYVNGKKAPKENWLLLLRAIYFDLNDYRKMLPVVKQLVHYYPKPQHLLTLASIYGELKQEKKMLGVLEVLYDSGHLLQIPDQLVNLARLYLYHDIPIKAARLLEKAIADKYIDESEKHLLLLSRAYSLAQESEKALVPLLLGAQKTDNPRHYVLLAQLYLSQAKWDAAERYFLKALKKNDGSKQGDIWLQLALSQIEQYKYTDARVALQKAASFSYSHQSAQRWLKYLESEVKRRGALESAALIDHRI